MKEAIEWEETKKIKNFKKYFSDISDIFSETFLFIDELEDLIKDEWQKPEKKTSFSNRLATHLGSLTLNR